MKSKKEHSKGKWGENLEREKWKIVWRERGGDGSPVSDDEGDRGEKNGGEASLLRFGKTVIANDGVCVEGRRWRENEATNSYIFHQDFSFAIDKNEKYSVDSSLIY